MRHPTLTLIGAAFAALALVIDPARVGANPADLDPTFGGDGTVDTDLGFAQDNIYAIVRQPDGMLVVAGARDWMDGPDPTGSNFAVARYRPDGTLDPAFGMGGYVFNDVGGLYDQGNAVVLQPDGKIVVAGEARTTGSPVSADFGLVRYNADGSLDTGFGTGGFVLTDFAGSQDVAKGLVLQPDGKLVAVGRFHFKLARYQADGTLDPTFGTGGLVTTLPPFPGAVLLGNAVALQSDGKLVVGGELRDTGGIVGSNSFALARYEADGSLDTTFGSGGYVFTDFPSGHPDPLAFAQEDVRALLVQPDGAIVAGGSVYLPFFSTIRFGLARYDATGALDPTFGDGGRVVTAFPDGSNGVRALALQPNGKIVAAGSGDEITKYHVKDFGIARYRSDGVLDGSFGRCGHVSTNIIANKVGGSLDEAFAVTLQPDGSIIAAGEGFDINPQLGVTQFDFVDFALARYRGGDPLTCAVLPLGGCRGSVVASKAQLQIKDSTKDGSDRFKWSWQRGDALTLAELGDPTVGTDYTFCVYDESGPPRLVFEAPFPAGDGCGLASCWKSVGDKGFNFKDITHGHCGIESVGVKPGLAGKSKAKVAGKGDVLPLPTLPLALPLRAQLQAANGTCLETVITAAGVTRNDAGGFKGRGE